MNRLLAIALLGWLLVACGGKTLVISGLQVREKYWLAAVDDIRPRASVELSCARADLRFGLLNRQGRLPTEIVVDACGKRALYVRNTATAGNVRAYGNWHLSTVLDPQSTVTAAP